MSGPSNQQNITFALNPLLIDYFELKEEYFNAPKGLFRKEIVERMGEQYLPDLDKLKSFDNEIIETVLLNFQVGVGKSSLFYRLISEYSRKNCLVIVCSPFKKLVAKDYKYLGQDLNTVIPRGEGISRTLAKVFNYLELFDEADDRHFTDTARIANTFSVHIMTVNCFVGNPGENAFEQNIYKSDYIQQLQAASEDKDVILFIDEVHESIHNFQTGYFPKLLKWKGLIKKIFIASATFTPPVIPVINLLSLLTENRITVYEGGRVKVSKQSEIKLNILGSPYNRYSNQLKTVIQAKVEEYTSNHKNVNIITATRFLAERIAVTCFGEHVIRDVEDLKPSPAFGYVNLLTGNTDIDFQKGQNNIGTTFKTGVDIDGESNVLMIVFPSIIKNDFKYGIFTDGISAIIQAVGRMRSGNPIELFIFEPAYEIGSTSRRLSMFTELKVQEEYSSLNSEYEFAINKYKEIVDGITIQIQLMEEGLQIAKLDSEVYSLKQNVGFWYPNFGEFLLRDRRSRGLYDKASFGKDISSYILWACLNNQFLNGTLQEITYYKTLIRTIELNKSNCSSQFDSLFAELTLKLSSSTLRNIIDNVQHFFGSTVTTNETRELKFHCAGDAQLYGISGLLSSKPYYASQFYNSLISYFSRKPVEIEKISYINSCIAAVSGKDVNTSIEVAYLKLQRLRTQYVGIITSQIEKNNQKDCIPANPAFPENFVENAVQTIKEIKLMDKIIKHKVISLLQDPTSGSIQALFKELFLNVSEQRRQIRGKRYFEIGVPMLKTENEVTESMNFLT